MEVEIRELPGKNGYQTAPVFRGSALAALNGSNRAPGENSINGLRAAIDRQFR